MVRILNVTLLLIAIVGGVFVLRSRSQYDVTSCEYARLTTEVGRLSIIDETKIQALALPTGDPLDFQWQVYLPPKFDGRWKTQSDGGSSTSSMRSQEARTELVRVRFRKIDGQWFVWHKSNHGSGTSTLQHGELFEKPETLNVLQFAQRAMEVAESGKVTTLLKITAPAAQGREELIFTVQFGSHDAWAKQSAKGP
ncbi:MAG: hypothetical protein H8E66_29860 [Planctomycetes bacterium]|nr:hypothetical protein [Planctomycetota bacterium]